LDYKTLLNGANFDIDEATSSEFLLGGTYKSKILINGVITTGNVGVDWKVPGSLI